MQPSFSAADAERLARDLYGIATKAKEFYSERDRVFHLRADDGREHVLKLVHPDEDEATLDFQIQALNWIAREDPALALPRVIRNKNGGQLVNSGQLDFMFSRKTIIEFPVPADKDLQELELELIDAGLEEMDVEEGVVSLIGEYSSFSSLSAAVEALGITPTKAGLQRLPTQPIELTEEQITEVEAILEKIEDDDDVQAVFTNLA